MNSDIHTDEYDGNFLQSACEWIFSVYKVSINLGLSWNYIVWWPGPWPFIEAPITRSRSR